MKKIIKLIALLVVPCFFQTTFATQILYYIDGRFSNTDLYNQNLIKLFNQHANKIDIIAPQVYKTDKNGIVWGTLDSSALHIARQKNVSIMPLVINDGFNQDDVHELLSNSKSSARAIKSLIEICKKYQYSGIQFDFENMNINDKTLYTDFIKQAATQFHKNKLKISVTVIPKLPLSSIKNLYDKYILTNWSGSYDVKTLALATDFITVMAYDRHTSYTTPGPIAPIKWIKFLMAQVLKEVPAEKISLGIANYSGIWRTHKMKKHFQGTEHQISFSGAMAFLKRNNLKPIWNKNTQSAYAISTKNTEGLYEYLFLENAKSFSARFALAKKLGLKGISVWQLGLGDPKIWRLLPTRQ